MKRLIEETEATPLESLMGKQVTLLCVKYFYTGELVGVAEDCVELKNPAIVYETGAWSDANWADCQPLGVPTLFVNRSAIEAFGVLK